MSVVLSRSLSFGIAESPQALLAGSIGVIYILLLLPQFSSFDEPAQVFHHSFPTGLRRASYESRVQGPFSEAASFKAGMPFEVAAARLLSPVYA